ncbi:hypothetical protein E4U22_003711 [Claviceps purpurea]|nr:hypothetical protein E4U22_003711 [Claviceps purpurea]
MELTISKRRTSCAAPAWYTNGRYSTPNHTTKQCTPDSRDVAAAPLVNTSEPRRRPRVRRSLRNIERMLHQLLRGPARIRLGPYREYPMETSVRSLSSTTDDLLQPGTFRPICPSACPRRRQTDETPPEAPPQRSKTRPVAERTLRPRLSNKPTDPATTQQEAVNNLEGIGIHVVTRERALGSAAMFFVSCTTPPAREA